MKTYNIIAAGFGGQGIMAMGQLMAYAGMLEGKSVSWLPSYGPEMRGGAANCSVVVSEDPVGSPVISQATDIIVMNDFSMRQFENSVQPGGNLLINSSLVQTDPTREDINIYKLPVSDLAVELGNAKVANMVMLGAFLEVNDMVEVESVVKAFTKVYGDAKKKLLPINKEALAAGMQAIRTGQCSGGVCEILPLARGSAMGVEDISRTPKAHMRQGNVETEPPHYLKDIRKYQEENDETIFQDERSMVREALEVEEGSISFYEQSAKHLGQDPLAQMFLSLAHQSQEHVRYLKGLEKSLQEKQDSGLLDKLKLAFSKDELQIDEINPENAQLALSIISEGMSIKHQSIKFYNKAAQKSQDKQAAGLYDELAYWEDFQLQQLAGQYEIFKQEWWSDQGYSPI